MNSLFMNQRNYSSPLLFIFTLEYAIKKDQDKEDRLETSDTDANLMGKIYGIDQWYSAELLAR
jgi:hypothetical protein